MARTSPRKRRASTGSPAPIAPPAFNIPPALLGYDPTGKMEQRSIVGSSDGWSEYKLEDTSVIRLKAVLLDVKRAVDQFNASGDPIYVMQIAFVTNVAAPNRLKRDYKKGKK
ncbi:MAG: hypothetical protein ACKVOI_08965 [Dongiaceae bacterium]